MTESSIPQQGTTVGDATTAPYDADEWSSLYTAILTGFGGRDNYGVIRGYEDFTNSVHLRFSLEVVIAGGANITVRQGAALVRGTIYKNTSSLTLTVGANASGNPRIDTVILRKDYVAQTVRAVIKQGTPAASPVAPTLTQSAGTTWEIPLADIAVANGFASIVQADVSQRQEFINVGDGTFIDGVTNKSGGTLVDGDVVVWDTADSNAVTTTTTFNNGRVAGVWRGTTASNGTGRLQTKGFGYVKVRNTSGGTLSIRSPLVTDSAAKQARHPEQIATIAIDGKIGVNLLGYTSQTLAGSTTGVIFCYIDVQTSINEDYILIEEVQTANTGGGTFTNGADRTRPLNVISEDGTGLVTLVANQFTLPPGNYRFRARAPASGVGNHKALLYNITAAATAKLGTSETSTSQSSSEVVGVMVLATSTTFELRHRCQNTVATTGMGTPSNFGTDERYAFIELWRSIDWD